MRSFDFEEWGKGVQALFPQFNRKTKIILVQDRASVKIAIASPTQCFYPAGHWSNKGSFKSWLWRVLGAIFNRRDWEKKGKKFYASESIPIIEEIVNLKRAVVPNLYGINHIVYIGYSPATDTLVVGDIQPLWYEIGDNYA